MLAYNVGWEIDTYSGWTIILGKDLNLSAHYWIPIGIGNGSEFSGSFNGNGHTISGIYTTGVNQLYRGLFGVIDGGSASNLKIANSTIYNPGTQGNYYAGSIAALITNNATISNCFVDKTVTVRGGTVGGIVSVMNSGTIIEGCISNANIEACKDYYNMGGIVGEVTGGTIQNCIFGGGNFNTAEYTAGDAGAIYGRKYGNFTTFTNNYTLTTLSGTTNDDGDRAYPVELQLGSSYNFVASATIQPGEPTADPYTTAGSTFYENLFNLSGKYYAAAGTTVPFTATMIEKDSQDRPIPAAVRFDGLTVTNAGSPVTVTEVSVEEKSYTLTTVDKTTIYVISAPDYTWYGTGTSTAPYQIRNTDHMTMLAERVNAGTNYAGTYFKQCEILEYTGTENNYTPIGIYTNAPTNPFMGTFDGDGKAIIGIRSTTDNTYSALFSYIVNATIKNLRLDDCQFKGTNTNSGAGAIVGFAGSTVGHTYTIENCIVGSDVTCEGTKVGGIAASSIDGTIKGCVSAAALTGNRCVGGIIGRMNTLVTVTLQDNLFMGSITYDDSSTETEKGAGAIIGYSPASNTIDNTRTYFTCETLLSLNGTHDVFAFAYNNTNMEAKGEGTTEYEGDDAITAYTNGLVYDGKLYLSVKPWDDWTGGGTSNNPYLIPDIHTMNSLALKVNAGNEIRNTYFLLTADLDYTDETYTPVGTAEHPFYGKFDGNGKTISHVTINSATSDHQGLFGIVSNEVKNLTLSDATITGSNYVGGIAGQVKFTTQTNISEARVENCHVVNSNINGTNYVGGIVGMEGHYNADTKGFTSEFCYIEGCTSNASVSASAEAAGGIVGQINFLGHVDNNLYLGVTSNVTAYSRPGLLIGYINASSTLTSRNYYIDTNQSPNNHDVKATAYPETDEQSYIEGLTPFKTYEPDGIQVYSSPNGLFYHNVLYSPETDVSIKSVTLYDDVTANIDVPEEFAKYKYNSDSYGNKVVNEVTYRRTFNTTTQGKYLSWFVPFNYAISDDAANKFEFFKIKMIDTAYKDSETGGSTRQYIHLEALDSDDILYGNRPYVFREKSKRGEKYYYDFVATSVKLLAAPDNSPNPSLDDAVMSCATTDMRYIFYGVLTDPIYPKPGTVIDDETVEGRDYFYYMTINGTFARGTKATTVIRPFRWIFRTYTKPEEGESHQVNAQIRFSFFGEVDDDEEATGIETTPADAEMVEVEGYYTLSGVKVQNPGKGLHIVKFANGETKKVFIK